MKPWCNSNLSLAFICLILLNACDKEQEPVPAYIHIKHFTFSSNTGQGLNTSDITSVKVFVNGSELGNYELPATLPVIAEGKCAIMLLPNIKENALSSNQKYFKPYTPYYDTVVLEKGLIDTIQPSSTYRSNTTFKWLEDFEDQTISTIPSGSNNVKDSFIFISTATPGVNQPFTGSKYCGYIRCKSDSFLVFERCNLNSFNDLPYLGTDVYVELDIKSNVALQVGVYTYPNGIDIDQNPVMVINPTNGAWKKIYVNLKPQIGDLKAGTALRLFFGFYKDSGDTEEKFVYLDNLKLVYVN